MNDEILKELNCMEIEHKNRPTLLLKAYNNPRTAVVVMDMVEGFCHVGALASENVRKLILPISSVLDFLPAAKKFFIVDYHNEESLEFKFYPPHCHNKEECAVVKDLAPYAERVIKKNSTNGVFAFLSSVEVRDFDNFLVLGDCTDICILQFCLSLKAYLNERGQKANVLTFTDYVNTFDGNLHSSELYNMFALKLMEQSGVGVFKKLV